MMLVDLYNETAPLLNLGNREETHSIRKRRGHLDAQNVNLKPS